MDGLKAVPFNGDDEGYGLQPVRKQFEMKTALDAAEGTVFPPHRGIFWTATDAGWQIRNRMQSHRTLSLALILGFSTLSLSQTQAPARDSVSSDDISVAEGLQLPTYGHVWALDTWKGVRELIRLRPPASSGDETGFSLKPRRTIEFKGEAAAVRVHDAAPVFFLRGVSGSDDGRSDLVIVRLIIEDQRRTATKDAMAQLKQQAKHNEGQHPDVIDIKQQRVGSTDWYRLSPGEVLAPGEYALVPLPASPGFAEGEIFDFAIDPQAPENPDPLRSEQYRGSE
jgi:hypothetical protein